MLPSIRPPPKLPVVLKSKASPSTSLSKRTSSKKQGEDSYNQNRSEAAGNTEETARNESPLLPLISEGSFTSLVSSKSNKSRRKKDRIKTIKQYRDNKQASNVKIKRRGGGFREYPTSLTTYPSQIVSDSPGVRTTNLQLNYDTGTVNDKGWTPQNPNPRLLKLQSVTGRFQPAQLNYVNFPSYTEYSRLVAAPHVDYLYHRRPRKQQGAKHDGTNDILSYGTQVTVNERYQIHTITATTTDPLPPPEASQPNPLEDTLQSRDASESSCLHRKTCACPQETGVEKRPPKTSSRQNSLERFSTMPTMRMGLQNTGARDRLKPPVNKAPPPISPPKLPQGRPRGMSLSRLRKKAKMCITPSSESNSNRRRSSNTIQRNNINTIDSKSLAKVETVDLTDEEMMAKKTQPPKTPEVVTGKPEHSTDPQTPESESPPKTAEASPEEMDITEQEMNGIDECDTKTTIQSVSNATTPRRAETPRLLKICQGSLNEDLQSLQKMFTKLDADGDGHISFAELQRSLPSDLSKKQISYLKKIYQLACESTYFGLEEFVAVHQMCQIMSRSGYSTFKVFDAMDMGRIEPAISIYVELFNSLDRRKSGTLSIDSFQNLLASSLNVRSESSVVQDVINTMGKNGT
ncbi:uncharacterized protein LOC5511368 isoform X2 [Nematostella vectensis]|uniref:uncharacterized protein LOC5511368 isoform X2 n=1 Tax=Nematostella vectensis TaxID=45351 RepID=UPI00207774D9|nr:uncharacterized protein LOC5511368 isoform X2 [Nematostella vectensis]